MQELLQKYPMNEAEELHRMRTIDAMRSAQQMGNPQQVGMPMPPQGGMPSPPPPQQMPQQAPPPQQATPPPIQIPPSVMASRLAVDSMPELMQRQEAIGQERRETIANQKSLLEEMAKKYGEKPDQSEKWLRLAAALSQPTKTGTFGETLGVAAGSLADSKAASTKATQEALAQKYGIKSKMGELDLMALDAEEKANLKMMELASKPGAKQQFAGPVGQYQIGGKTVSAVPIFDNQQNIERYMADIESGEATPDDAYKYGATDLKKLGEYTEPKTERWESFDGLVGGRTVRMRRNLDTGKEEQVSAGPASMGSDMDITLEEVETIAQMLANGEMAGSDIPKRGHIFIKAVARAKQLNPELDVRQINADYALSKNPGFRSRAMLADSIQHTLARMKEVSDGVGYDGPLDYSNIRSFGKIQEFFKRETNDPQYTEFMTLRADLMLELAHVLRGAGASDAALKANEEVFNSSMSPRAMIAWAEGQLKSLQTRYDVFDPVITPLPQLRVGSKYQGKTVVDVGTSPDGRRHAMFDDGSTAEIK